MLLNIYLGTTAISWATTFIFAAACERKLKRDGYKFVKEKNHFQKKLRLLYLPLLKVLYQFTTF